MRVSTTVLSLALTLCPKFSIGSDVAVAIDQCTDSDESQDYVEQLILLEQQRITAGTYYIPFDLPPFRQGLNLPNAKNEDYLLPWFANVIPEAYSEDNSDNIDGLPDSPPEFSNIGLSKWPAFPLWMMSFNNLDPDEWKSSSNLSTIFFKNLEDRGPDNQLKKFYMNALTCDKMPLYESKIDILLDDFVDQIVNHGAPVMSTWESFVFKLYLDLHLGSDVEHPQYVKDYIKDLTRLLSNNLFGSNGYLLDGMKKVSCASDYVQAYFEERRLAIIENDDDSTFVYWWDKAGIPKESLVFEAAHNILAFGQHVNTLFLVIRAKLAGIVSIESLYETPSPLKPLFAPIDFFAKYQEANSDSERLNVAREAFRILMPNNAWVSGAQQSPGDNYDGTILGEGYDFTSVIMFPQFIQAFNDGFDPLTGASSTSVYDTSRYEDFSPPNGCPFSSMDNEDVASLFKTSSIDGETVVPKTHAKFFPVYEKPEYCPFGLGYRRCPAEIFNMFFLEKVLDKLGSVEFSTGVFPPGALFIPITQEDSTSFDAAVDAGVIRVPDIIVAGN